MIMVVGFSVFYYVYSRSDLPTKTVYPVVTEDGIKRFDQGYLKYREGIPFVFLKGDSYQMGLQYGVLLKDELARFQVDALDFEEKMVARFTRNASWLKKLAINLLGPVFMEFKVRSFKSRVPEDYLARLRGIAEGSKIPLTFFLRLIFVEDLFCSSFVVKTGRGLIHGRNGDHSASFMGKYPIVVHYQKVGKYSYIDVNVIGIPYVTSGINEHGICLSWSGANARDIKGNGTMLMFNRILEECRSLEEVDKIDKDVDRFVTVISSQADQTGVIYDLVGDTAHRIRMETPFVFAVNHCASPEGFVRYNTIEDLDWPNRARSDKYQEILSGEDPFTVDKAVSLLADTGFYQYPMGDGSDTINNYQTLISTIFEPEGGAIYFAAGTHYAAWSRWIKYNILTDEVSVFRGQAPELGDIGVKEFLELREKFETIDYESERELTEWAEELERSNLDNIWILERLARLYLFFKKDLKRAWVSAEKLMDKYPDFEAGYRYAAEYFRLQHKMEQALAYYRKALNCPLKNPYVEAYLYEMLASVSKDIGSLDDARRFARNALDLYSRYGTRPYMQERISKLKKLTL